MPSFIDSCIEIIVSRPVMEESHLVHKNLLATSIPCFNIEHEIDPMSALLCDHNNFVSFVYITHQRYNYRIVNWSQSRPCITWIESIDERDKRLATL